MYDIAAALIDATEALPGNQDVLRCQVFAATPTPMLITDASSRIRDVNVAFERTSGYRLCELLGQRPSIMRSHMQDADFYRRMWAGLLKDQRWQGEIWNCRKDGSLFREWLSVTTLHGIEAGVCHYLASYSGLISPQLADSHGLDIGGIDTLTGVLTRHAYIDAANRLQQRHSSVEIMTLHIDRFTEINEQFGMAAGDRLLREVALCCTQVLTSFGGHRVVGRVGPDEFAFAWSPEQGKLAPTATHQQVQQLASHLHKAVSRSFELAPGRQVQVSAHMGLASLDIEAGDATQALQHASAARHDGSAAGCAVQRYEIHDELRSRTRELRQAIVADQIEVALQPKVDLRTGALTGFEALARWTDATGRQVPPSEFIELAERRGMISELGDRVLEKVLRLLAACLARATSPLPIAVNFSAPQLHRQDVKERLTKALKRHGLGPHLIELELTESILLGDAEGALDTLQTLREHGFDLAIDDFGTGYSSLAYLRRFPVNALKIDRSFVSDIDADPKSSALVGTVIALAHQFGMRCIAEGVETMQELAVLRALGCDEGQGYLFARPLLPDAIQTLLDGPKPWASLFH